MFQEVYGATEIINPEHTYIYGLLCPIQNKIRYVGKANNPAERYRQHLRGGPGNKHKGKWLGELTDQGMQPKLVILEKVANQKPLWESAEIRWFDRLVFEGHPLTNNHADIRNKRRVAENDRIMQEGLSLGREMFGA